MVYDSIRLCTCVTTTFKGLLLYLTSSSIFFHVHQVWVRVASSCVFQMAPLPPVSLQQLGKIDFKIRTIELDGKRIKLQIWDTAGQERFRTITTAYYRGAMGILLVYDVTDESSFNSKFSLYFLLQFNAVPKAKGQALADEYGIKFFETSAKTNLNVEEVFFSIGKDIKQRLADTDARAEPQTIRINQSDQGAGTSQATQKSACCGS
ncbi:hypothetical protein F2Q68_00041470 [Brassica cretica]|uniref:Uncharacterized protein n=1 Tax=Brassica cretica TaxID=69181 RepID=A0A8S9MRQ4_BRACR|nr:hypothetical protein F2Q68_00041470 [Brassica cretica]